MRKNKPREAVLRAVPVIRKILLPISRPLPATALAPWLEDSDGF
jgi:hypothetical protein